MKAMERLRSGYLGSMGLVAVLLLMTAAVVGCAGGNDEPGNLEGMLGEIETDDKAVADISDTVQLEKGKATLLSGNELLERTAAIAGSSGGDIHYIEHEGRGDRTVLVTPRNFVGGGTPLVVSLHGFGGNSAVQAEYVALHERVNADGFALLLPNGVADGEGNRFWNPTDGCCEGGKSGLDDVAYLTELVEATRDVRDFGWVYFFGYSNGGFMANHMGCKGLFSLRAVASLAGTSYVGDSSCEGAPPVSALQIHGTDDGVILFEGDETEESTKGGGDSAFYLGAGEMVERWSRRAGCEWPAGTQPYDRLDLDQFVAGAETRAYRLDEECAEGISIELWVGEGSGHTPGLGEEFVNAVVGWLLEQR